MACLEIVRTNLHPFNRLKQVENWTYFCEQSGCLNKIQPFNQFRFFKFVRKSVKDNNGFSQTSYSVLSEYRWMMTGRLYHPTTGNLSPGSALISAPLHPRN